MRININNALGKSQDQYQKVIILEKSALPAVSAYLLTLFF